VAVDRKLAIQLANQIFRYATLVMQDLQERRQVDGRKGRILADLRDYFMYAALRAGKEEARGLVSLLTELEARADKAHDRLHAGFFFTLAQLLSLRYTIAEFPGEKISFEDWHRSFEETLRKLGIPGDPIQDELALPCPECGSLRTRVDDEANEAWCQNCFHKWGPISFWRM
jgi:hypothetical protein